MWAGSRCQGKLSLLKIKSPGSFLPRDNLASSLESLCRPQTELVHTYLRVLQEKSSGSAWCVGEAHILSGVHVSKSRVFTLKMTNFPSPHSYIVANVGQGTCSCISGESMSLPVPSCRQDAEVQEEEVSV